jgi:hypothetical protein
LVAFASAGQAGRIASAKLKELQKSHQALDNENQFSRHEFIEALVRIADLKYSRYEPRPDLTYRVHRLLEKVMTITTQTSMNISSRDLFCK